MSCCDWNPQTYFAGFHCTYCCTVVPTYRLRDRHVSLNHQTEVVEANIRWLKQNRTSHGKRPTA